MGLGGTSAAVPIGGGKGGGHAAAIGGWSAGAAGGGPGQGRLVASRLAALAAGGLVDGSASGESTRPRPFYGMASPSPASLNGGSLLGSSFGGRGLSESLSAGSLRGVGSGLSVGAKIDDDANATFGRLADARFVAPRASPYGPSRGDVLPDVGGVLTPDVVRANFLTDAHIRSLGSTPTSLPKDRRTFLAVPPEKDGAAGALLHEPTHAAQDLRRSVLKDAVVVIITTGSTGKRFVYERMAELGVRTFIIDGPDSWAQVLEDEGVIERFVPVDMTDASCTFDLCRDAIEALMGELGVEVDAVSTYCEIAVPLVARLAESFGLPGNPSAAVDAARDKHATRVAIQNARLPSIRNVMLPSPEELVNIPAEAAVSAAAQRRFASSMSAADLHEDRLHAAGADVGYPLVMKPVSGAASIGVLKVEHEADLTASYLKVMADMLRAKVNAGALILNEEEAAEDDDEGARDWPSIMLEEYLDGDEVDVDVILSGGSPVYSAVSDNWPCEEPWFNETGDNAPTLLGDELDAELQRVAVASCHALGLTTGVFHVELKATSRGPRLIEVNCRMGGGPVRDINLQVNGVDLVEEHLFASAGIPCNPPFRTLCDSDAAARMEPGARAPLDCVAGYTVNAPKTGVVVEGAAEVISRMSGVSYVLSAEVFVGAGDRVVSKADGLPTWMGEVRVRGDTAQEALERAELMREEILAEIGAFISSREA